LLIFNSFLLYTYNTTGVWLSMPYKVQKCILKLSNH